MTNHHKKGGGVAIYVDNNWANYVTVDDVNSFSDENLEIITVLVNRPNHRKMSITCVYRPPKSNQDLTYGGLSSIITRLAATNRDIWIGGDFNWDWNRRNFEQLQKVKILLRKHNLQQLIKGITRPLVTGGTCIDWLITNSKFVTNSGITSDMI